MLLRYFYRNKQIKTIDYSKSLPEADEDKGIFNNIWVDINNPLGFEAHIELVSALVTKIVSICD